MRDAFAPPQFAALSALSEPEWRYWRSTNGIPLGTPFLIAPDLRYDVQLNKFFYSVDMLASRMSTRLGYARDLKGFLDFLEYGRNGTGWRDANAEDHRAYLVWRREDVTGPRVSPSTWDRGVSAVDRFYRWQVDNRQVATHPIPQRAKRNLARDGFPSAPGLTPATYSHSARRGRITWLPARSYRIWRDVGLRGYGHDGLRDPLFRGRWADRNAVFTDLMVRTGLRLAEQSALTTIELPGVQSAHGYHRFWLPEAIAKGGSARWVYVPTRLLRALHSYMDIDRRVSIARAQRRGTYERANGGFLYLDDRLRVHDTPMEDQSSSVSVRLEHLTAEERRLLLMRGQSGWEPASLWLSEEGMPISTSTWKDLFRQANQRCAKHDIGVSAHAHMLRHTFAVLTLEQLQRGHIASLTHLNPAQRNHYTRVFGDPLDWVRQRLGHKSVTTTQVYLHALEELEMQTRMTLVSDPWEDSRDSALVVTHDPGSAS
ncbi:tyrosine-type recombinase/integrase [Microbacterium sp. CFBP9034]|uniref:tyrosine-type recombinase/integrase n=1 Tax=Microbacterium sp. CFBP9034 TaxID=3096540 RepID=UPI002A6A8E1A|nr:tyrosine-type recombinase/integrase [Microbacterium sp. CFBP9034]MDY0909509.1 tyrosine-type recombinase/integrase [Microbacterium sp. CFBP9034]